MRGLVRISGPGTNAILAALVERRSDSAAAVSFADRKLVRARLKWNGPDAVPVLVCRFERPRSYTGQDMAEIQCPGHPLLLERLLHRVVEHGGRLAEAGEFTFRAFVAGKMDLTRAEGVSATIAATSDGQLQAAQLLRRGRLGTFAEELVEALGGRLALVEAGIDFSDQEDVVPIGRRQLEADLAGIGGKLSDLLSNSRSWSQLDGVPRVVLAGHPSSGKSTLFNALLGQKRAVVSPSPGTTRDVLVEPWHLSSDDGRALEVMLVDVAGLDEPQAALDRAAQAAARVAFETADLIVQLGDGRGETLESWRPIDGAACPILKVRSKADLPGHATSGAATLAVSAQTGAGLDGLRRLVVHHLGERAVSLSGDILALQPRHETSLRAALDHVEEARRLLAAQIQVEVLQDVELVASTLRAALDELAGLGGALTPDDVIGRVFSTFCVGK